MQITLEAISVMQVTCSIQWAQLQRMPDHHRSLTSHVAHPVSYKQMTLVIYLGCSDGQVHWYNYDGAICIFNIFVQLARTSIVRSYWEWVTMGITKKHSPVHIKVEKLYNLRLWSIFSLLRKILIKTII